MKKQKKKSSSKPLFLFQFFKYKNFVDIFFVILLILLLGYTWRLLPQTVIRSDGFVHMLQNEQNRFWDQDFWFTGIEVGPSILGAILPKLFGPHISLYLWFELAFILLIGILFYILVRVITKSQLIAFAATLIAGVNYFGMWEVYGSSCYCYFLERVINMPFMIVSLLFLHLYLVNNKKLYLILSFLLYFIGIGLGHVELILTPAFMLYPFWWFVFRSFRKDRKEAWKGLLIGAVYFLISAGIVWAQRITYGNWGPGWTLTEFALNPAKYDYFKAMALQLVYWSDYLPLWGFYSSPDVLSRFSLQHATASIPYAIVIYAFVFLFLFVRLPKLRALLLTCFTSVPAIFFLNAYVKLDTIIVPNSNRYLYFPTFFLNIFWGIFVWFVFFKHGDARRLLGIVILIVYYAINATLLDNIFHRTFELNTSTKALFEHVIQTRDKLYLNTMVIATYPEFWVQESNFFTQTLGKGTVRYYTENTAYRDWKTMIPNYKHVIKIHYDEMCDCVKETKIK